MTIQKIARQITYIQSELNRFYPKRRIGFIEVPNSKTFSHISAHKKDSFTSHKPIIYDTDKIETLLTRDDAKTRLMAANELLIQFQNTKEQDPKLIELLNKVLMDKSSPVEFVGLTILDLGYTKGNGETIKILQKNVNKNSTSPCENSRLAEQLLKKLKN